MGAGAGLRRGVLAAAPSLEVQVAECEPHAHEEGRVAFSAISDRRGAAVKLYMKTGAARVPWRPYFASLRSIREFREEVCK